MKLFKLSFLILSVLVISCKPAKYADLEDGLYADVVTNKGDILLKLEFDKTPVTVANFVSLAEGSNDFVTDSLKGKHYYNGTVFHRVIPDFMIQGGDPLSTGSGGPGYKFIDEFPKDSLGNLVLTHASSGVLSMANSGPETNGSQFFITHKDTPWLDGKHTVFGNVEIGQEVVDSIVKNDTIKSIDIIKVGKAAKSFKAAEVFSNHYTEYLAKKSKQEEVQKLAVKTALWKFNEALPGAIELPSGLKYAITDTKNGVKPTSGDMVRVHYAGYFSDGRLFDTSYEKVAKDYGKFDKERARKNGYAPFKTVYGPEARLIPGFKEGLQQMSVGDKAIFFIPSHLGYGAQGAGGVIPPNTDLVFELELVEIVK
ncbi:peptidylprolyl isomerase [Lutibacter holmesii]|uniref:peptidylprolyl isomerase n=1 Tax=Lutibacter holmesii TaxID=1137985 RepID=A0ABW3WN86_9FLAO